MNDNDDGNGWLCVSSISSTSTKQVEKNVRRNVSFLIIFMLPPIVFLGCLSVCPYKTCYCCNSRSHERNLFLLGGNVKYDIKLNRLDFGFQSSKVMLEPYLH